MLDAIIF